MFDLSEFQEPIVTQPRRKAITLTDEVRMRFQVRGLNKKTFVVMGEKVCHELGWTKEDYIVVLKSNRRHKVILLKKTEPHLGNKLARANPKILVDKLFVAFPWVPNSYTPGQLQLVVYKIIPEGLLVGLPGYTDETFES